MPRAQLALRVSDLEASITFSSKLFGTEPAKRREGYANFTLTEPPFKLGPGKEPWEVYVVKADAGTLGKSADPHATGDGCCTDQATEESPAAAGCACGQRS
ncbi:hypothetical protein [Streptomyces griseoluteus]|uniref:hypothetical protein n=1 Tax=Streptomyces griseoluteus TaxID=29306 RepID=UPI0037FD2A8C